MSTKKEQFSIVKLFVVIIIWAGLMFALINLYGCGTIHGAATDIESGGRIIRETTQKSVDAQRETRIRKAYAERDAEMIRAAELVLQQTEQDGYVSQK